MKSSRAVVAALVVVTVLLVAVSTALGFALMGDDEAGDQGSKRSAATEEEPPLQRAFDACQLVDTDETLDLGDGGKSLIVNTESEYGSMDGLECVTHRLKTSSAILAQIDATTAMMGVQQAEQDGLEYRWSYHPDNGVNMTITSKK